MWIFSRNNVQKTSVDAIFFFSEFFSGWTMGVAKDLQLGWISINLKYFLQYNIGIIEKRAYFHKHN